MRAQADRILKQAGYEVTNGSAPDAVPQVITNERLTDQKTQLADLRRKLAELSTTMTPRHPKVRELQAQITELDSALAKGRTDILSSLRIEFRAASIRDALLRARYESQARTVQDQANHTVDYGLLKQDADTNRRLYEALLQKLSEFGVTSALRASNTRVLDLAPVPVFPAKPDLLRNLALGLVSGIMLGAVFVLGRYRFDRSIKAPGETAFHLRIPELGVIPTSTQNGRRYLPSGSLDMDKAPLAHERDCVELATWQNKTSIVAESFRNTLASLLSPRNGAVNKPRVIVITSPGRGEGKSSTASNLGIALAEINQKVLLIDADMRKAGLHAIFDLPNSWGLSDLLRERNSLKDCPFEALARKTEIEGLYLLPAGPGTVSISNLLYSNRMRELLARLRSEFDTILIDTPPMLYVSDARVLGRLADSALLVIRAGQTTRDAAVTAKQRILDDGVPV